MIGEASALISNVASCHFEKPVIDIFDFCWAGNCGITAMSGNLVHSGMELVGSFSKISKDFEGFPVEDNMKFKDQMEEIGDDVGTLLRSVLNFHN